MLSLGVLFEFRKCNGFSSHAVVLSIVFLDLCCSQRPYHIVVPALSSFLRQRRCVFSMKTGCGCGAMVYNSNSRRGPRDSTTHSSSWASFPAASEFEHYPNPRSPAKNTYGLNKTRPFDTTMDGIHAQYHIACTIHKSSKVSGAFLRISWVDVRRWTHVPEKKQVTTYTYA